MQTHKVGGLVVAFVSMAGTSGCRNASLWNTANPVNVVTESALNSPQGAAQAFQGALGQFATAVNGVPPNSETPVVFWAEVLSDEYSSGYYDGFAGQSVDARYTTYASSFGSNPNSSDGEPGDIPLEDLLQARSALLLTVPYLAANEEGLNQALTGEAEALVGYAELYMAEFYCAGVPLSQSVPGGGIQFGVPIATDSLLGVAEAHFRAAVVASADDMDVQNLASVGLGRTLVDRGQYDSAAAVVANVPTGFVYQLNYAAAVGSGGWTLLSPTYYAVQRGHRTIRGTTVYSFPQVSNSEGGVGYNYLTANDPRLVLTVLGYSWDGRYNLCCGYNTHLPDSLAYWPVKFGSTPSQFTAFPLATGIEARMIQAEDTLQHQGNLYAYLNLLRSQAPSTYIGGAAVPAFGPDTVSCGGPTDPTCVQTFFREKAFWLYGLGNRLGDMRREERPSPLGYGLPDASVYPTGAYWSEISPTDSAAIYNQDGWRPPWSTYGTDVSLTLPTTAAEQSIIGIGTTDNPYFHGGCLAPATTATP